MKLTYGITVHNEGKYLEDLLEQIIKYKDDEDEIILLDDFSDDLITLEIIDEYKKYFKYIKHALNKDFGKHKNVIFENATGDYIFQLDSDEIPHEVLLLNIKEVIKDNENVELYYVPRANTINPLTLDAIKMYGWNLGGYENFYKEIDFNNDFKNTEFYKILETGKFILEEKNGKLKYIIPCINPPDYQSRIYKNDYPRIRWDRTLHETIVGYNTYVTIPPQIEFCLFHHKTLDRQIKQNNFYIQNWKMEDNVRRI